MKSFWLFLKLLGYPVGVMKVSRVRSAFQQQIVLLEDGIQELQSERAKEEQARKEKEVQHQEFLKGSYMLTNALGAEIDSAARLKNKIHNFVHT